jgi:hypothetical protein
MNHKKGDKVQARSSRSPILVCSLPAGRHRRFSAPLRTWTEPGEEAVHKYKNDEVDAVILSIDGTERIFPASGNSR